jgi:hypothetical protein
MYFGGFVEGSAIAGTVSKVAYALTTAIREPSSRSLTIYGS